MYGGKIVFSGEYTPQLLAAVRDFVEYYPDEKAAIILTADVTLATALNIWVMFIYYKGPTPPNGTFDNFTGIPSILNTCGTTTYYDLLSSNNEIVLHGFIYRIFTESMSLPSSSDGAEVMGTIYNYWYNVSSTISDVDCLIASLAFQPMPRIIAQKALDNGGDVIDLDTSIDRIVMEMDFSYCFNSDNGRVDSTIQTLYTGMKNHIATFQQQGKLPEGYLPLFMNDAYWKQDYVGRLRPETQQLLEATQRAYDPTKFWETQTHGWSIPS